ncbi:zinc-ribbon domain-containing protein [Leifsonia sp. NPDC056665]|uniref:zinc-ribbon domain-containing protein n=1 Tax=Leifsonia sp. NPDC056665 TaxID=3345901 RepID=UPI0036BC7EE7
MELLGTSAQPPEPHTFNPSYALRRSIGPLEPFSRYVGPVSAASRPLNKLFWELESVRGAFIVATTTPNCRTSCQAICPLGHRHETTPLTLANAARSSTFGCPVCAGTVVVPWFNSLAVLRPDLAAHLHPTRNSPQTAETIYGATQTPFLFVCRECQRSFQAAPRRLKEPRCDRCRHPRTPLPRWLVLEIDRQFEPHTTARTLEENLFTVHQWRCRNDTRHRWTASTKSRLASKSCPICAGRIVLVGVNDLAARFPEAAAHWDYEANFPLLPKDFTGREGRTVFWTCAGGHSYRSPINIRRNGPSCSFCRGLAVLDGFNSLATVRPEIAQELHPYLNAKTARQISWGSGLHAFWNCPKGHIYMLEVFRRSVDRRGCTVCKPIQRRLAS